MQELESAVFDLIDVIQDTEEYKQYQKMKKELARNPVLRDEVDSFRLENYALQTSNMDSNALMQATDEFERKYEDFRSNPLVNEFLASELAFIRMMQYVYDEIIEAVEFE